MKTLVSQYILKDVEEDQLQKDNLYKGLYYSTIGCFIYAKDHFLIREEPDFFMIIVCTAGEGFYIVGDRKYIIKQGDTFFCFPHIYTSYGSSIENPWTIYWVHFNGDTVKELLKKHDITSNRSVFMVISSAQIINAFEQIIYENNEISPSFAFQYKQSLFNQLFFIIMGLVTETNKYPVHPAVTAALSYINSNLHLKINLDDLAKETMISKFYLSHLFKQQVGISTNRYITDQRIKLAKNLLLNTSNTISNIAQLAGFESSMYFSNTFKKYTGKSPGEYRK